MVSLFWVPVISIGFFLGISAFVVVFSTYFIREQDRL
jgi:hypothetical protein